MRANELVYAPEGRTFADFQCRTVPVCSAHEYAVAPPLLNIISTDSSLQWVLQAVVSSTGNNEYLRDGPRTRNIPITRQQLCQHPRLQREHLSGDGFRFEIWSAGHLQLYFAQKGKCRRRMTYWKINPKIAQGTKLEAFAGGRVPNPANIRLAIE